MLREKLIPESIDHPQLCLLQCFNIISSEGEKSIQGRRDRQRKLQDSLTWDESLKVLHLFISESIFFSEIQVAVHHRNTMNLYLLLFVRRHLLSAGQRIRRSQVDNHWG